MTDYRYMRPRTIAHGSSIYSSVVKMAGEEREPHPEDHPSSPEQKLRPRAEVILYTEDGVWGIKNPKYLLLPGGGIPEGQRPDEAAIVEALEEADRLCHNLEERSIVSTIYDKKYMSYKDWDGEVTHFFIALDGGPGGMNHKDREKFTVIPFEDAMSYLSDMMNKSENEWAHENNQTRMRIIQEAQRRAKMEDNGLIPTKYAYWREGLPRYLKRSGTYKALATYIESLSGKNIVRAMNSEAAIAAKKEQVKRLYNKELNKAFATKSGPKITKLQGRAAGERRKGFMGAIDQIFKTSPDKAGPKAQVVAERSGAVNKERLRKLEDMKAKLTVTRPMSVVGEQMRTNDARFLTATGLIGGGIVGGNYLVNKSKNKPFTSDGPAYMMPPGFREPISVMKGIPPMQEIKQASYKGENNMGNEIMQKIAEEAILHGYEEEMDKLSGMQENKIKASPEGRVSLGTKKVHILRRKSTGNLSRNITLHDMDGNPIRMGHDVSRKYQAKALARREFDSDLKRVITEASDASKGVVNIHAAPATSESDRLFQQAQRALFDPEFRAHYPNIDDAASATAPKLNVTALTGGMKQNADDVIPIAKGAPRIGRGIANGVAAAALVALAGGGAYAIGRSAQKRNALKYDGDAIDEWGNKVKAASSRYEKLIASTQYPSEYSKHAEDDDDISYGRVGAVALAPAGILAGGAATAAGASTYRKTKFKVREGFFDDFQRLDDSSKLNDPVKFVKEYTHTGHKLMNDTVEYKGKTYTADQVIKNIRSGNSGNLLKKLGLNPGDYGVEAKDHYKSFIKSPESAYNKLLEEHTKGRSYDDIYNGYKGNRWKAVESLARKSNGGKINAKDIIMETARNISKDMKAPPEDARQILRGVIQTERELYAKNPKLYNLYNTRVSKELLSNNSDKLHALDKVKEKMFRDSGLLSQGYEGTYKRMMGGKPDYATSEVAVTMRKNIKPAVESGYGLINKSLKAVRKINRNALRTAVGGSALLAGSGALGYYGLKGGKDDPEAQA